MEVSAFEYGTYLGVLSEANPYRLSGGGLYNYKLSGQYPKFYNLDVSDVRSSNTLSFAIQTMEITVFCNSTASGIHQIITQVHTYPDNTSNFDLYNNLQWSLTVKWSERRKDGPWNTNENSSMKNSQGPADVFVTRHVMRNENIFN